MNKIITDNVDMTEDKKRIDFIRYTLRIPLELSIRLDVEISKSNLPKNRWFVEAIREKLEALEKTKEKMSMLEKEIHELRSMLKK